MLAGVAVEKDRQSSMQIRAQIQIFKIFATKEIKTHYSAENKNIKPWWDIYGCMRLSKTKVPICVCHGPHNVSWVTFMIVEFIRVYFVVWDAVVQR